MPIPIVCSCGKTSTAPDSMAGLKGRCPSCNSLIPIPSPGPKSTPSSPDVSAPARSKKQYKVLTQKDKWFSGKFDPEKLEEAMNAYADQGWEVKAAVTASIPGFGGNRDELIVIMERF